MEKKGIISLVKVMIAVAIIILILALAGPIKFFVDTSSNVTIGDTVGLDCVTASGADNTTLNKFQEANCLATDLLLPSFVWIVIGIAGAVILARIVLK
jgi:hypothetical protein